MTDWEAAAAHLQQLSDREREALALLARLGHAKAVAREMGISARTVETHLFNARRKLEVETTYQALGILHAARAEDAPPPAEPSASLSAPLEMAREPAPAALPARPLPHLTGWRLLLTTALAVVVLGVAAFWIRGLSVTRHAHGDTGTGRSLPSFEELHSMARDAGLVDEFNETFEAEALFDEEFRRWSVETHDRTAVQSLPAPGLPGEYAVLFRDEHAARGAAIRRNLREPYEVLFLECWLMAPRERAFLRLEVGKWGEIVSFNLDPAALPETSGRLLITGPGGAYAAGTVEPGRWHHLQVVLDARVHKYCVWLDGALLVRGQTPPHEGTAMPSYAFDTGGTAQTTGGIYLARFHALGLKTAPPDFAPIE